MQIVDPHMHLWNLKTHRYPWLDKPRADWFTGPYDALAKTHELADFLGAAKDVEVLKIVHVEAGHDPSDPVAESRWLQSIADDRTSGGRPNGIVAAADLSRSDAEKTLEGHKAFPSVRGIRQVLNFHESPFYDYVGKHFMRDPAWQAGFKLLRKFGFSFDLHIYPSQMLEAADIAKRNPETTIIVNHTGLFIDRDSVAGWRTWRDGMRALAACPNVMVKISGMGMIDHHWTVESIRPLVLETIDCFGIDRSMFASNFPVDSLYGSYPDLWRAYHACVARLSDHEKQKLFRTNAEFVYRI
jgi:predicted TIM-barrel fold metal-dependent hydrolase